MSDLKRIRYFGRSLLMANVFVFMGALLLANVVSAVLGSLLSLLWAPAMTAVVLLPILTFIAVLIPTRIYVGTDGVLVAWLGSPRFIAHSNIEGASAKEGDVVLSLRCGESVALLVGLARKSVLAPDHRKRDALLARVHEALTVYRRWGSARDVEALVGRGERDVASWLRALHALTDRADYRVAPVMPEALLRVVEDPSASTRARAGAAVALRRSLDRETRARLLEAAELSASPRLRVALEVVSSSSSDDAKILRALGEVEDESAEPSAVETGAATGPRRS